MLAAVCFSILDILTPKLQLYTPSASHEVFRCLKLLGKLSDIQLLGSALILIVSPVAADLAAVVEETERMNPGIFGPGGAYAQAFALFNCSMAVATVFGPVAAGFLVEHYGWEVMTAAMGVFAFSGAVPAVSIATLLTLY